MVFIILIPNGSAAASYLNNEIDIVTTPEKVLFDVSNLVPGDSVTRKITIKNSGKQDFKYTTSEKFISGSEKLFKELQIIISDKNHELYKGKLSNFKNLEPRFIANHSSENLNFTINVPATLGNDFQGLDCGFQLKFYVEGTLGGILPANGPKLPATGSNMFNILVAGATLILTGTILQFVMKRRKKLNKQL